MNRCLALTLAVLLVSAGINQLHCEYDRQTETQADLTFTENLCLICTFLIVFFFFIFRRHRCFC